MADFMKELDAIFNEVKDQETSYERLPDGEYLTTLTGAVYKMSKKELPMVEFSYLVTHGKYEGHTHRKFLMLTGMDEEKTRKNITAYANEIKKFGIDTSKGLHSTFDALSSLEGTSVKVTIKTTTNKSTHKEYLNTYIEVLG